MALNRKVLIIATALLVIAGCQSAASRGPRLGIYLVQEPSALLENIKLAATPLLTEKDIVSYNWEEHRIVFTEEGFQKLPKQNEVGVAGKQFVLVVDGKRCYLGAFWTGFSSISCPYPVIDVLRIGNNTATIQRAYPQSQFGVGEDPRPNKRLKQLLAQLKKLN
jgi:hypothetical protein